MSEFLKASFFLLLLNFIYGCEKEPKQVIVTYQLSHQADTTFAKQYRDKINKEVDSICFANRELFYNQAKDSLMKLELNKIEQLLD